jgi:plasmid stabilization system protein ParE
MPKANAKFISICEYIESEWSERIARNFASDVYRMLDLLKIFPEIGSIEQKRKNIRGLVITKQTTLFYTIKEKKVILLTFFDTRQHPSRRFE